jgi:hypothetical protein
LRFSALRKTLSFNPFPNRNRWGDPQMIEWLLLPALVLIVVLAIVTAKPKPPRPGDPSD